MIYDKILIRTLIKSLPDEITENLESDEMVALIEDIEKKQALSATQKGDLDSEITYRMLGLTSLSSFATSIGSRLSISQEKAALIGDLVEKNLIRKIPPQVFSAQEEYAQAKLAEYTIKSPEIKSEAVFTANELGDVAQSSQNISNTLPVVEPDFAQDHIIVKEGEKVHEVPHVEAPANLPTADPVPASVPPKSGEGTSVKLGPTYPDGKDPYREPLN